MFHACINIWSHLQIHEPSQPLMLKLHGIIVTIHSTWGTKKNNWEITYETTSPISSSPGMIFTPGNSFSTCAYLSSTARRCPLMPPESVEAKVQRSRTSFSTWVEVGSKGVIHTHISICIINHMGMDQYL